MRYAVVACATSDWLPAAAITLLSCAKHGQVARADFLICVHDPSPRDARNLDIFNFKHGTKIRLVPVDVTELEILDLKHFGVGAVIRLKLDQYLNDVYDRVLYLDSDTLVLRPINELLSIDLGGYPVGAVRGLGMLPWLNRKDAAYLKSIGIDPEIPYFNSGVMLFDWRETIRKRILPRAITLLQSQSFRLVDQDVLNLTIKQDWKQLDQRWNVTSGFVEYAVADFGIRHFTGINKPWSSECRFTDRRYHTYYLANLRGTPWESFTDRRGWKWSLRGCRKALRERLSLIKIWRLSRMLRSGPRNF